VISETMAEIIAALTSLLTLTMLCNLYVASKALPSTGVAMHMTVLLDETCVRASGFEPSIGAVLGVDFFSVWHLSQFHRSFLR